ncbi:MAG: hypothetical protein Q8O87_02235 [bacterium]|nr:hypothetical protein [bacterium]
MKKYIIILVALVVVGAVVGVAMTNKSTGGPEQAAEDFLVLLRDGDLQAAYDSLSDAAKNKAPLSVLENLFNNQPAATEYDYAEWASADTSDMESILRGMIVTVDGFTADVVYELVKADDQWRVNDFSYGALKVPTADMPSNDDLIELVDDTMALFADAVAGGDFDDFYDSVSRFWRKTLTVADLNSAFKTFIDNQLDLSYVDGVEPVFDDAPSFDSNRALVLEGHYPSETADAYFELGYIYERQEWKLIHIKVRVQPK